MNQKVEIRDHLGPHEIEIDNDLYGIILIGDLGALMSNRVFSDKDKAIEHAETFKTNAFVVKISSTDS